MNYQKVLKSLKKVSYLNVINYYYPIIDKKLKSIFLFKNISYLRNSSKSYDILKRKFGKSLDFDELKQVFFDRKIFSYSNNREALKLIEILKQNHSE